MRFAYWSVSLAALMMPAVSAAANEADAPDAASAIADRDRNMTIVVNGQLTAVASQSGTKTRTPLIETPQTITLIDNEELVRRNALSINQALTYVAGVGPNQRGNVATRYDQLTIRGFSPAVFLDGMRLQGGTYSSPQIDFHRIEGIDVVKGPASVLYGNSTPGGLINLSSKVPQSEAHGTVEAAVGNFDLLRGAVDSTGPIDSEGRFLYRIIGGAERSDGFVDHTENERYYVSPMLSFVPDEATAITLIAAYQRDPKGGAYGSVPPIGSAVANPNGQIRRSFYDGEPSYEAFDRKQWSLSALFRHDFNEAIRYRANARYIKVKQHYRSVYNSSMLPDLRTIERGGGGSDESFSTFTIDNNIAASFTTGPLKHELLAGLDFIHNEGTGYQRFVTGAANGIPNLDIYAPVYGVAIPDVLAGVPPTFSRRNQIGVYAQDQVHIGGLNLIGSIRKDWYEQRTTTSGVSTALRQSKTTYRAGALYAFTFGLSSYFSYSTSFEPQSGVNLAGESFIPVTGRQYEAGLKFQPRGTDTILTLSVYDLARQNVPVTDPDDPRNTIQVGEVKTRGIELEGRGSIRPGLEFSLAGTYMDSEFARGNPPSTTVVNGAAQSGVTGTRPLAIPKWTASSFLSYDLSKNDAVTGPLGGLTIGAGIRYVGGSDGTYTLVSGGITTATRFRTAGYTLVDALIAYDLGRLGGTMEGVSLAINASNLFDKRHVTSCLSNNWCWFGAPRTVVASLRYKW
ncbi:TonB-dependent siderophore receptor [Sphingobium baderi]|nr:TonB-dependent siderophore receptor [Sphingobium baderi]